jgi:hypothetical protein
MFDWSIDYNDPRGWGVGVGGRTFPGGGGWGNQPYPYNPSFPPFRQDNQMLVIGAIVLAAVIVFRK